MLTETGKYCGRFVILDIGLDEEYLDSLVTKNYFTLQEDISPLLMHRGKFSHKGTFGHAGLVCGSFGKSGAAVLASSACLRSGAGKLTSVVPNCATTVLQSTIPEAMLLPDENEKIISSMPDLSVFNAMGAGPGIGTEKETQNALKLLIQNFGGPLVLDADALNILADNKTWIAFLRPGTILTPHPKEFDRMFGAHTSDFDRLQTAREQAVKNNLIIVLKGAHSAIVTPGDKVYFNSSGNPGMAKGGSGDVLTGILTGLLSRGYAPFEATMLGVFLHGLAADIAAESIHFESLLATDIVQNIDKAFVRLEE
jgi:NAD(P)H-hydrate epimerase